jgi:hypothetical protein
MYLPQQLAQVDTMDEMRFYINCTAYDEYHEMVRAQLAHILIVHAPAVQHVCTCAHT